MKKNCTVSGLEFEITEDDLRFYEKMGIITKDDLRGLPTLCPEERERRRWSFRGNHFWIRQCDLCKKSKMSWFSPQTKGLKTICETCFRSENFEALDFGQDFDFSQPFFPQFFRMFYLVPKHISNAVENENCEFIISAHRNKNCYMADEVDESKDCYFGYTFQRAHNFVEGLYIHDSEIGYQCVKVEKSYAVFYSKNVFHCSESAFLENCRSCKKCLFSTNLRNKEYYVFNQKVSPTVFQKYWDYIFSGSQKNLEKSYEKFNRFLQTQYFPAGTFVNNEDCSGNYVTFSKNALHCFAVDHLQDCKFCTDIHRSKDCFDVNIYEGELCYESNHVGPKAYLNRFCQISWYSSSIDYSIELHHCQDCFGCTGLKNKRYCIFNKQYSKEEYFELKAKIIEHMKNTGEWGEFFPTSYSPQPYNVTFAQQFFPLKKEIAGEKNFKWLDEEETLLEEGSSDFPENISEVDENITNQIFICSLSGKKFRFVLQEIRFYKKWKIPLPTIHPLVRMERLWKKIGPRKLWARTCDNGGCEVKFQTTFAPERPEKVFCEKCYLEVVD